MCLFQFWFPQGICLGVGLLGYGGFIPSLLRNLHTVFPQWLHQFTFPPTVQEHSFFYTASPAFIACRLFDDGHSDWSEVVPRCSFYFISSLSHSVVFLYFFALIAKEGLLSFFIFFNVTESTLFILEYRKCSHIAFLFFFFFFSTAFVLFSKI